MKLKSIFATVAAVAGIGSLANAQTVIDLVGSTAARGAVHDKIQELFAGSGNTLTSFAFNSSSGVLSSNQAIFHGNLGGNAVIIRTFWAGSVNGIQDIVAQIQQTNLYATTVTGNATGQQVATTGNLAPASADTAPEIGFSDVFSTSTQYAAPSTEEEVAVLPFKFYKNDAAPVALDNITPLLAQQLYGSFGEVPLALFTGNSGDQGTFVYAFGRNNDSGTRITAMAESGYGVFGSVSQYGGGVGPTISGDTITALGPNGNSGASSGSTVASWLNKSLAGGLAGNALVAYLGPTDWAAAESTTTFSGPAVALKWNGVAYSEQAVREGQYTFWGYLHQNNNGLAGVSLSFFNALRDALVANPENSLLPISSMQVQRDGDGAPIYPLY
jgi:hypothetical protein